MPSILPAPTADMVVSPKGFGDAVAAATEKWEKVKFAGARVA
jgi:hypothetical protein